MSKRRLSEQQRRRIAGRRQRSADGDPGAAPADDPGPLGPEEPGLVLAQYGSQVDLLSDSGRQLRCQLRANLETPVAGDRVLFRAGDEDGVVIAVEARRSALTRPDKYGKLRCIAANIDQVVIVLAAVPEPHGNLIDRYLVACGQLGAQALLYVNKADLLQDEALAQHMDHLLAPYPALGFPVLRGTAVAGVPQALLEHLRGHNTILAGQSGVGKSTLINALLPGAAQRIGALSEERGKGRHTTTTSRLFPLAGGGAVIDSPGIREFGLWHLSREEVELGFPELRELMGHCRFRDCRHTQEPGCALQSAVAEGRVHPARLASYRHILGALEGGETFGSRG